MQRRFVPGLLLVLLVFALGAVRPVLAQDLPSFQPGVRVYDETGDSLTADQIADVQQRLDAMAVNGPNAVVVVRDLMATPEETLAQVEALQQAWAAANGIDDDLAVAILINRNPDKETDARAGIYVGKTLNDGNVPEGEQRAIVDDALIPPMRDGDVYTSLTNAITRLESSYLNGPPQSAATKWAKRAAETWLIPVGLVLAAGLAGVTTWLHRKRDAWNGQSLPPVTVRPDSLHPAVGAALALGGAQASAIPATVLRLGEQGLLVFEPESDGGFLSKPTLQVRLHPTDTPTDEIDCVVWRQLQAKVEDGVVSSKALRKVAADPGPSKRVVNQVLRESGWTNPRLTTSRNWLGAVVVIAGLLAVGSLVITGMAGNWVSLISVFALVGAVAYGIWAGATYSPLTSVGQATAAPWKAYRSGLEAALKQESTPLDLNAVLVDSVALNLGNKATKRVEAAQEAGIALNAFAQSPMATGFPVWIAFNSAIATTSGSASSTVSGGGAGGGGGAAGST